MSAHTSMRSTTPTNVTDDNIQTVVRDTLTADATASRNYAGLAAFYGLTYESASDEITAAARAAVLAAYPDTDPDRLKGKGKNDDQRWLDARTIRAGLVRALKASAPATDDAATDDAATDDASTDDAATDDAATDYIAMVRNAVQQAAAHGVTSDQILAVVAEILA